MRSLCCLPCLILLLILPAVACGQEWITQTQHHPWGSFLPGSWKLVRITTDKLDAQGKVLSTTTTDTITTLVKKNDTCYTLMIDTKTRIGGRVYGGRPKLLKRHFRGDGSGRVVANTTLRREAVKIANKPISSEVRRIVYTSNNWTRTSTVHYSPTRSPFVLRRVTESKTPAGAVGYQTDVQAKTIGQVRKVLGEPKIVNEVEVVHKEGATTTTTVESHCGTVPGAVIAHNMQTVNENKVVLERSRLELIDYHVSAGKGRIRRGRRGLLPWRRKRRK